MLFYLQHPAKPSHHCPPCPVPTLEVTPSTEWCWTWNFLSEQTWLGWAALNWSQLYLSHIQRMTKIHRRRVQQVSPHLTSPQGPVSQSRHFGTNTDFRNSCPCFYPFLLIPSLFCVPSAQSWQVFAESCCEPDQWLSQSQNQRTSILIMSVQLKLWIP